MTSISASSVFCTFVQSAEWVISYENFFSLFFNFHTMWMWHFTFDTCALSSETRFKGNNLRCWMHENWGWWWRWRSTSHSVPPPLRPSSSSFMSLSKISYSMHMIPVIYPFSQSPFFSFPIFCSGRSCNATNNNILTLFSVSLPFLFSA